MIRFKNTAYLLDYSKSRFDSAHRCCMNELEEYVDQFLKDLEAGKYHDTVTASRKRAVRKTKLKKKKY